LEGLTEVQRQKEFLRQGIFFLTHNPYLGKFVLVKFIEFWNPLPNSSQTLLVVISVLSMLLLLTLTTLGLLSFMKRKRPHLNILLYGMALFYIAVALIFFGGHRARLPAEYLLLLSSSPFLETVLVRFKEKKIGSLGNG
jgi:threonine/homoserine/homoserine lactone efflux protein